MKALRRLPVEGFPRPEATMECQIQQRENGVVIASVSICTKARVWAWRGIIPYTTEMPTAVDAYRCILGPGPV